MFKCNLLPWERKCITLVVCNLFDAYLVSKTKYREVQRFDFVKFQGSMVNNKIDLFSFVSTATIINSILSPIYGTRGQQGYHTPLLTDQPFTPVYSSVGYNNNNTLWSLLSSPHPLINPIYNISNPVATSSNFFQP